MWGCPHSNAALTLYYGLADRQKAPNDKTNIQRQQVSYERNIIEAVTGVPTSIKGPALSGPFSVRRSLIPLGSTAIESSRLATRLVMVKQKPCGYGARKREAGCD
jgi:hypothetical protein